MKLSFIEAGEIVNTHGVRGELKVLPWMDGPEDLLEYDRCRIARKDYVIESARVQKTCTLLKLQGVDTMEDAMALRGKTVLLFREDAPEGLIFAAELVGMEVYCEEKMIGAVSDVLDYPGNKVYVVKGEREYMIPAVKEFILDMDMEANRMQVKLIEGMALDAD